MSVKFDTASWSRLLWMFVAFVVLGVGVGTIWWPSSQEISQLRSHSRELYEEANGIDDATRRAGKLREAQARVERDLQTLGGVRSAGAVTAAILRLAHNESRKLDVEIREVSPEEPMHAPSAPPASVAVRKTDPLLGEDIAIGVRGPFRNIVSLLADLPRHDVLIDVHDVQLTSDATGGKSPILNATLHSTIYRLVSTPLTEGTRERTVR